MFSFMKKDKEKDREKKEKKKKEKEEKHEKKEKREKKERQNITPEEMSRLEDVKRSVFHRLSDRDHYRKSKASGQATVGKSESSESNISAASGSESSSSGTQPSPSRELPPSGTSVSRSKSMPGQKDQEKARPQVSPKPRSILKSKASAGGSSTSHDKLDDAKTLQDNTRLNEEMSGMVDVNKQAQSTQLKSSAVPPSAMQKLEPVEETHTEKSFEGRDLPLPPLVRSKPPRIREVTVKRNASGGFGFSLRKGTLPGTDGAGVRSVVFAEPGLGATGNQTGLLPGDRLVELNGKNVESWSREEIVELIKTVSDCMVLKVQPIPELIELSVRPGKDGSSVDMQEDVVKGGTLKRSGSMRYRKPAKSEDEVETERQWLEAEHVWLVHKGGFTSAKLQPGGATDGDVSINIKLDSGEILTVDEDDVEKANPSSQDKVEDLAVLRYLNESSALHVLRQRHAASLPHTYAGPALLVINPLQHLPLYSEKLIQMFRGCKQEDMPPHVFSAAQMAYRDLLSTRRDQSLVFVGRSGSGKTTSALHCLHYLLVAAGSVSNIFTVEKLSGISTLLQSFGNCRTLLNTNASRFTQITTLDFDPSGVIASASVQVVLFEKSRVVRRPEGEPTFNIFYHLLAGADAQLRNELHLQNLTEPNQFMTPLQKEEDRQRAANSFGRVLQAFQLIGASSDEVKAIFCVLAAVYHLGVAGATKGTHNKFQFSRPAAAQKAASLLGTTPEELARSIFTQGAASSTSLTRSASLRVPGGMDKAGYQTVDAYTSVTEALEAFVIGLYSDAFNAVVSLINRSLSSNVRTMSSLVVVDTPGFQNPASCGRQTGANFEDLCCNYLHERMQLLYHENTLTAPQDRYAQENIDCDCDMVTSSPASMVSLMDHAPQQGLVRTSNTDLKSMDKRGLLWILDEEAMFPGASEDSFMERLFTQHGEQQVRKDSLLRKGSRGFTFVLNHNQGTAPVQYNAAGWLRVCRDSPVSRNSIVILQDSKSPAVSQLFGSLKASVGGVVSGSIAGMEGSTTLRRVGSMRRTFMSGTAALKKKSVCLQVKFQVDSVMETLRKTQPHFVFCFLPQQTAGLCEIRDKMGAAGADDRQLNVPLLRSQLRGFEILDALRLHRQGFPEFMEFREFVQKFHAMVPPTSRPSASTEDRQAVNQVLDNLDVDKLNYRVGLSKVFFRPGVLSQLEAGRDEKLTGIVTHFQALCRGYLGRKKTEKLRVQHLAVRCIQRNVTKYLLIREWPWWKLYTKVKPILNVHRTEEELLEAQAELETMKTKTEKLEKERNEYKAACEKLETRLAEVTADLMEENTTSTQASEMLEAESAERMRLEKELKELQAKYSPLKRQNEKLQMEVMQSRVWQAQSMEEEEMEDEVDGGSSVYKERCQKLLRELQVTKKQMQQQHEEDLEQELTSRKMVEKRLHEAVEEAEEQRRQVQVSKKKTQRLTAEMQDMRRLLEEQMARNNELERKQRRFDNELGMAHEDVREEKQMREKLQRERDQLLSEKYSLEQTVQSVRMDHQSVAEKAERLDKELNDILVSGKDNSEVVSLKRAKHELELKLREQEEELDDQAGQIQQLEQTKLRLEMNMEKMKKQHQTDIEEKEEELEDMRTKTQKKLRSMESQLEEEYEEKRRVMEEKAGLERQLQEYSARAPARDRESEKRLRRNLKKTKALLADAGTMLAKQKNIEGAKQQIAQLRNQLDEAEFRGSAAVKAKKRMELEIQDLQQQMEDMSRAKQEVESKNMALLREKADLQSHLEDNEEEMSELMKKYKAAVQQQSVHQITMTDQLQQIEELMKERDQLKLEVSDLTARVQGYEEGTVDKHTVTRLESKLRDVESRAELEQSQRQRFESQTSRLKEQMEKLGSEKEDVAASRAAAEEVSKRAQKQLRDLREELADAQKKEMEASQKFKERENEMETLEAELAQSRADLKLAFKRIADLQAALEDELDSDDDSLQLDDSDLDSEDDDNEDLDSYLGSQQGASLRTSSTFSSPRSDRHATVAAENGLSEA
ncbi:unconventional myosin-XVIIIa-like [Babylonia areolata]|uniref:unconventional myosin-XVIIIa-like n=1 Tax=Babylonia areolata TaxID=304850 RepID=UPI003FD46FDE